MWSLEKFWWALEGNCMIGAILCVFDLENRIDQTKESTSYSQSIFIKV